MLDRKYILENADLVKQNCTHRGVSVDVDRLVQLDRERREQLQLVETLNRQANDTAKS
ncbi:MAG: serine--tRNA ligase, partial [Planctomycetota bacterium]